MKIFINNKNEIVSLYESSDTSLTSLEIDRVEYFGNMSDFIILNHYFKIEGNGHYIYPKIDLDTLIELDKQVNKISILQQENKELKESQLQQDRDILVTQEAVDFLMLSNMPMVMNLNNIKLGGNTMAAYIATRIMKKGNISIEAGRDYYVTFLTHQSYIQYKSEVDLILKAEGKEELIVDLSNM